MISAQHTGGATLKLNKHDILDSLTNSGLLDYGAVIPVDYFRDLCGIVVPESGTLEDFKAVQLEELSISDWIRGRLLNDGKYFKLCKDSYRVLLPSENAAQIAIYMSSADSKLKRALRLHKNTDHNLVDDSSRAAISARLKSLQDKSKRDLLLR